MPRRPRFSLANALLAATCIALAIGWWATTPLPKPPAIRTNGPPGDSAVRELPITIAASEVGSFATGYSWYLSVNSAGLADLKIENHRNGRVQQFTVSSEQLAELRELLVFHSFFSLADDYGEIVPDGSTQTMTITVGEYSKTVRIHFLMNWMSSDPAKLREPAKALFIWDFIRGWFQYPEAVDTRPYDQRVLNAVKTPPKTGN